MGFTRMCLLPALSNPEAGRRDQGGREGPFQRAYAHTLTVGDTQHPAVHLRSQWAGCGSPPPPSHNQVPWLRGQAVRAGGAPPGQGRGASLGYSSRPECPGPICPQGSSKLASTATPLSRVLRGAWRCRKLLPTSTRTQSPLALGYLPHSCLEQDQKGLQMGHLGLKLLYSCSHRLLLGLPRTRRPSRRRE